LINIINSEIQKSFNKSADEQLPQGGTSLELPNLEGC
jgi:hypothetical protein